MNDIIKKIHEAAPGDSLVIDDLTECCNSIDELIEMVHEISHKGLHVHSLRQKWFDTNSKGENPLITLIRISQLQKAIEQNKANKGMRVG